MASKKAINFVTRAAGAIGAAGRAIGARRVLFAWSAASAAIALFCGISIGISIYNGDAAVDLNAFVLTQFLETLFMFAKLFLPMFMLIVAVKYIFDNHNRRDNGASPTLKLACAAAVIFGLAIGALYYIDAAQIVHPTAGALCAGKAPCPFAWDILWHAGKAAATSFVVSLLMLLGIRGIYNELAFMLGRKQ